MPQCTNPPEERQVTTNTTRAEGIPMSMKWKDSSTTDKVIASGTWGAVIGSLVLVFLTYLQIKDIENSSKKQLRAYISVLPPVLGRDSIFAPRLIAAARIKNSGQTPAYDVVESGDLRIIPIGEMNNFPDPRKLPNPYDVTPNLIKQVIGPGVEFVSWREATGEHQSHRGLSSEDYRVIFYGIVFYKDAFGHNHWTSYAYAYHWWINGGEFYTHEHYNDADNE
jgi:hypothetical protein